MNNMIYIYIIQATTFHNLIISFTFTVVEAKLVAANKDTCIPNVFYQTHETHQTHADKLCHTVY